jgi:hypothetical protein
MKKLILRLLALILSVYVAGSIYPLLAHEAGHSHAPAPAPAPAPPPPAPTPVPSGPAMVDTKGPGVPLAPPPSTTTSRSPCDSTGSTGRPMSTPTEPTYVRAGNALTRVTDLQRDLANLRNQRADMMLGVMSSPDEVAQVKAMEQNIKNKEAELRGAIDHFNGNFSSYGTLNPNASNLGAVQNKINEDKAMYPD